MRLAVLFVLKLPAVLHQVRLKNILGFSPLALQHDHPMLYVHFSPLLQGWDVLWRFTPGSSTGVGVSSFVLEEAMSFSFSTRA